MSGYLWKAYNSPAGRRLNTWLASTRAVIYITTITGSSSLLHWLATWHTVKFLVPRGGICGFLCHSCMKSCGVSQPQYYWYFGPDHSLAEEGSCLVHCSICVLYPIDAGSTPFPTGVTAKNASRHCQMSLKGKTALDENHRGKVTVMSCVHQARTPTAVTEPQPLLKSPVARLVLTGAHK